MGQEFTDGAFLLLGRGCLRFGGLVGGLGCWDSGRAFFAYDVSPLAYDVAGDDDFDVSDVRVGCEQ